MYYLLLCIIFLNITIVFDFSDFAMELSEVLYFEVKCFVERHPTDFEVGFQSATRGCHVSCKIKGSKLILCNNENESLQFTDTIGCGLIWPIKKVFFTIDGVGSNVSFDLVDMNGIWMEDLDEIIPYFSKPGLQVNFGQQMFWSQSMNLSSFRRNSFQLMYEAILRSEEGI